VAGESRKDVGVIAISDDLSAPDVIADPQGYFGRLRETDPVHWNDQKKTWIVTRHRDVLFITRSLETFGANRVNTEPEAAYPPIPEEDYPLYRPVMSFVANFLTGLNRPDHDNIRRAVSSLFTPRTVERWREEARSTVREILEQVRDQGRMDVKEHLAAPLPLLIICQLLDIPTSDASALREMSEKYNRGLNSTAADRMPNAFEGMQAFEDYFVPLIESRAKDPHDDLISVLAVAGDQGLATREQVLANVSLMMDAGHETTLNLISNGILALVRHPAQWRQLASDPEALCKPATEECLRYDPPIKLFSRICRQDVELDGKSIREGDRVSWAIVAANRDPEVFDEPETFDITRAPNPHVTFGGGGAHQCLGAALARLEGQEVFRALPKMFKELRLETESIEYQSDLSLRSLKTLEISWET
jgi:cytochrome P450